MFHRNKIQAINASYILYIFAWRFINFILAIFEVNKSGSVRKSKQNKNSKIAKRKWRKICLVAFIELEPHSLKFSIASKNGKPRLGTSTLVRTYTLLIAFPKSSKSIQLC